MNIMFFYNKLVYSLGVAIILVLVVFFLIIKSRTLFFTKPDIVDNLNDYNFILINIDSLRADHLGCYGYYRNTSPFIDYLARHGVIFDRAMSNSSFTCESVSVLLSGRLPSSGNAIGWRAKPSSRIKNMGELFREAGYKTAFLSNTNMLSHSNFTKGFQEIHHLRKWGVSGNGPWLSSRAGKFIKKCNGEKFMIYLHYLDPHGPYRPPVKLHRRFVKSIYPNPLRLYGNVRENITSLVKDGFGPGDVRFEDMVVRYDAEIAHIDKSIEALFGFLKTYNLLKNTFVLITADHGEEFLEHHYVEHAWTLYNESLHIPLILWAPDRFIPKRFNALVSTVDLLPTLLEIMAIPHIRNDFDGTSLFTRKGEGFYFVPPNKPFIAELLIQHRNVIRAVIKDDLKYIAVLKWVQTKDRASAISNINKIENNRKLHIDIWGTIIHEELYDLSIDPQENNNLINKEEKSDLRKIIEGYKIYCKQQGLKDSMDVDKEHPHSQEDVNKLKALGYL